MILRRKWISIWLVLWMSGCTNQVQTESSIQLYTPIPHSRVADVLTVNATGGAKSYQFNVKVSSPDTGCDQYADWWEVLGEDGRLLYRRVLLHSHVDEQPFTRSGGPVPITADMVVYIRAHMNVSGYGGRLLKGTIASGFQVVEVGTDFAAEVEAQPPLPENCAF